MYKGGKAMSQNFGDVRFYTLSDMQVATFQARSFCPEDDAIDYMKDWFESKGIQKDETTRAFGKNLSLSPQEDMKGLRGYEAMISVPAGTEGDDKVRMQTIKGDQYAVMRIKDPFKDPLHSIPLGWKILKNWVNTTDYRPTSPEERHFFEEIVTDEEGTHIDLYHPILTQRKIKEPKRGRRSRRRRRNTKPGSQQTQSQGSNTNTPAKKSRATRQKPQPNKQNRTPQPTVPSNPQPKATPAPENTESSSAHPGTASQDGGQYVFTRTKPVTTESSDSASITQPQTPQPTAQTPQTPQAAYQQPMPQPSTQSNMGYQMPQGNANGNPTPADLGITQQPVMNPQNQPNPGMAFFQQQQQQQQQPQQRQNRNQRSSQRNNRNSRRQQNPKQMNRPQRNNRGQNPGGHNPYNQPPSKFPQTGLMNPYMGRAPIIPDNNNQQQRPMQRGQRRGDQQQHRPMVWDPFAGRKVPR